MDIDLTQGAWRLAMASGGAVVATLAIGAYSVISAVSRHRAGLPVWSGVRLTH